MMGTTSDQTARLIVCQRGGQWKLALEQARRLPAAARPPAMAFAGTLAECEGLLARWPASLLAIEATEESLAALLAWLADLERRWPLARAVVLLPRSLAGHELALREAGAVWAATSTREAPSVLRLAHRHIQRAPEPELSLIERIEASLPWSD